MLLTSLLVAALAAWEMIEIYHHSVLFAGVRARVELIEGKLHALLECPFCMSPWVSWLLALPPFLVDWRDWWWPAWGLFGVWWYVMCGFAVARLANLGNDLTHAFCRTPRANKEIPTVPEPAPDGVGSVLASQAVPAPNPTLGTESKATFED